LASGLIAWSESNPGADDCSGCRPSGGGAVLEQFSRSRISNAWFPPFSATRALRQATSLSFGSAERVFQ
jgi:hypothetical protein